MMTPLNKKKKNEQHKNGSEEERDKQHSGIEKKIFINLNAFYMFHIFYSLFSTFAYTVGVTERRQANGSSSGRLKERKRRKLSTDGYRL